MKKNNIFIYFILIAILFVGGCKPKSKSPLISPEIQTDFQLRIVLLTRFKVAPILEDSSYQLVNEYSIGDLYKNYRKDLFDKGIIKWNKQFDCNRFSLSFQSFAQISYSKEKGRAESIAIGEVYYIGEKEGPHAINIIITPQGPIFLEPQTGEIISLNQKEIESIWFIKF